ncbi:hypothetical protein SDJN03_23277, partial [Cucurbita argyrosperma subsp. sororia]
MNSLTFSLIFPLPTVRAIHRQARGATAMLSEVSFGRFLVGSQFFILARNHAVLDRTGCWDGHPHLYSPEEVSPALTHTLRLSNLSYSYFFARKFSLESLTPLMSFSGTEVIVGSFLLLVKSPREQL